MLNLMLMNEWEPKNYDPKDLPAIGSPLHAAVIHFMSAQNRSCNM
mgnify:FL=1